MCPRINSLFSLVFGGRNAGKEQQQRPLALSVASAAGSCVTFDPGRENRLLFYAIHQLNSCAFGPVPGFNTLPAALLLLSDLILALSAAVDDYPLAQ